ncbi:hypothetical protein Mapa_015014 [Marchantia paleacea]|nr:hypothetical protein Mapa_015014 [Marchantia paleacea]
MEAKFIALSHCAKEAIWIHAVFIELGISPDSATTIFSDNQAAIAYAHNNQSMFTRSISIFVTTSSASASSWRNQGRPLRLRGQLNRHVHQDARQAYSSPLAPPWQPVSLLRGSVVISEVQASDAPSGVLGLRWMPRHGRRCALQSLVTVTCGLLLVACADGLREQTGKDGQQGVQNT